MSTDTDTRGSLNREFIADYPVEKLGPHPKNAREHDRDAIRESLETNNQYAPVIVQRSTGLIISGNGRYSVATEELGWTTIDVLLVDVDDARALKILAADNRVGEKSSYRKDALGELLTEIAEEYGGLEGTGYSMDDYEDLLSELAEAGEEALASLPLSGPPPVLEEVPRTDASYAETPEEEEARAEKVAQQVPNHAKGLTEVVLVYTEDEKVEFSRLVGAARGELGQELRAPEIVLRAMRVLMAALDGKHDPTPLDLKTLLHAADVRPEEEAA